MVPPFVFNYARGLNVARFDCFFLTQTEHRLILLNPLPFFIVSSFGLRNMSLSSNTANQ